MSEPRVAICVVTYNSVGLIKDLVSSLPAGAAGTRWQLVFADNASSDGTVTEINRCAPNALVVETGANLGYAAGVNAAIRTAGDHDGYLILNADVRLLPGCVKTLFDALRLGVGVVVPKLLDEHGKLIWSMRREPSIVRAWADALLGAERVGRFAILGEVVTDSQLYEEPRLTDWAEGSTQLVGAECSRMCGEWNESLFLFSEETEFDLRARDHGYLTWYEPAARARHLEGGSASSPRQWSLLVVNRVRLFRMRHGRVATSMFWMATATREATRALLGKEVSKAAIRDLLSPARMRQMPSPDWLQDSDR